jgi:hypothetical protein
LLRPPDSDTPLRRIGLWGIKLKWFKHFSDCQNSESLSYLLSVEGFSGYGRWFRLLEIVAARMDKTDICHAEYPIGKWCSLLGLKQKKLISFLELTENQLKTNIKRSGNIIRIEIPNLLILRDEYSAKSGQTPDTCRDKIPHIEVDTEVDTEAPVSIQYSIIK